MEVNQRTVRHQQHATSHGCRGAVTRSGRGLGLTVVAALVVCCWSAAAVSGLPLGEHHHQQQQQQQKQSIVASGRAPAEGLEFPNTAQIPGDLTEQLGVDGFFSLWFVFLDDDVFTSDKAFTILAPSNGAPTRPSPTAADKDRVRQLLLNHIVLGRAVNVSADLIGRTKPLTLTTLGGQQIHLKHRKDGAVVNGVKIIDQEIPVQPNGVILILEDYLFMDQYHGDVEGSESQWTSSIPMVTTSDSGDHFPMIELGTHSQHDAAGPQLRPEPVQPAQIGAALAERQKLKGGTAGADQEPRPFYDELVEVLNFLRSGTSDFLRYLEQVNVSSQFTEDAEYTAFIPMDDSFAQWYPIDWGFNPFDVESFVSETILNHFVKGKHTQKSIQHGDVLTTLGGKKVKFAVAENAESKNITINGIEVFAGDTPVSRGNIQFVGDLLFVDAKTVGDLNAKHRDVESAPLIISPWYSSQFLSHLYRELSTAHQFNFVLDYLNRSQPQLHDDLPSHDEAHKTMLSYTFFAPRDSAFLNLWPQDTADPFVIDASFRRDVLLSHFVRKRLYHERDLVDGAVLEMADGKRTAKITRDGNVTKINDAVIEEKDIFVYNLGTVFVIDRVLFADQDQIGEVYAKNADKLVTFALDTTEPSSERPTVDSADVTTPSLEELINAPVKSSGGGGQLVIIE